MCKKPKECILNEESGKRNQLKLNSTFWKKYIFYYSRVSFFCLPRIVNNKTFHYLEFGL